MARCSQRRSVASGSTASAPCPAGAGRWPLDEVFVKINGVTHYLWRTIDHEGEVLEALVIKRRDRKAELKFLRKTMKRHGRPHALVRDKRRSYGAALKDRDVVTIAKPVAGSTIARRIRFVDLRFTSAVPTTGTCHAPLPPDAIAAEVCRRPLLYPQPVQRGAHPLQPGQLQGQPHRRSQRVASALRCLTSEGIGQTETGSH